MTIYDSGLRWVPSQRHTLPWSAQFYQENCEILSWKTKPPGGLNLGTPRSTILPGLARLCDATTRTDRLTLDRPAATTAAWPVTRTIDAYRQ